jgi:iron complex outermembrane receptor protein
LAGQNLKPEYTISEEAGYRYTDDLFIGSATFFNYNFTNRQLSSTNVAGGEAGYINAGGQTSRGVDAELGMRPLNHFSPYISAEYLDSHYNNNTPVGNDYLPTAGKVSVESPPYMFTTGLSYDDSTYFGNVMVMYKAYQYTTFMDDQKIPGYVQANMALGYRIKELAAKYHPELKLNFINIGNVHYLSGPSSVTTNAQTQKGVYGTSIPGSEPVYYVGGGFAAVISLSMSL